MPATAGQNVPGTAATPRVPASGRLAAAHDGQRRTVSTARVGGRLGRLRQNGTRRVRIAKMIKVRHGRLVGAMAI